jgi:hypothetical protein
MAFRFNQEFSDWQTRRNKFSHGRLKNEILNILLSVTSVEEATTLMDQDEWKLRLQSWLHCLEQGLAFVASSPAALSPARCLEHDVWLRLSAEERRHLGRLLDNEWWTARKMIEKIDAASAALRRTAGLIGQLLRDLDQAAGLSPAIVESFQALRNEIDHVHRALKAFDFHPLWSTQTYEASSDHR